ncbi:MAG TPA: methyltransferase domain-containing protein, partial [Thermoanaerobaculia bacterium]
FAVRGVEPNREMREAGERFLSGYPGFTSIVGTAEATTLPSASAGLVVVGQAFHWFDRARCRPEFVRILKPGGGLAVIWNERDTARSPFLRDYEALIRTWCLPRGQVEHNRVSDADLAAFFAPEPVSLNHFTYRQRFDLPGLEGRLLSSSYTPEVGNPNHEPMLAALRELFDRYQRDGFVDFPYDTQVYYGRLSPLPAV